MKERGLIFSAPMVCAVVDGRKTQTRRVVRYRSAADLARIGRGAAGCPYGVPGDRLWVRETWAPGDRWFNNGYEKDPPEVIRFRADGSAYYLGEPLPQVNVETWSAPKRWKSALFMPRWASRLTLELTEVRVQRLQEISEHDAAAEGVAGVMCNRLGPNFGQRDDVGAFRRLWSEIHGPDSWGANPWVWALTFEMVKP